MTEHTKFEIRKDIDTSELPEYIDKPEYVKNKTVGYGLMAVGWTLWMWLFLPILTLLFWWFEGSTIYEQVLIHQEPASGLSLLKIIFVIGILIGCLLVWASYNWVRFNGRERRKTPEPVSTEQLASSFKVEAADIETLRAANNITLHYDENGVLYHYDINVSHPPKKPA